MSLVKRTYVDGETVITAENLNDIQDAIIENEEAIEDQGEAIEGKYTKPSGGIPSTDLASAVQTSLGKADTAYQKPSGGIPSTDLASAVQTSLGKADTALQSSDIDNTLSVTGKAADAKKTGDEISDVKNTLSHKADMIYDSASGDIASFPDGADGLPVKDLTVAIEPVQDLHGYDNPWPAGGGKNKIKDFNVGTVGEAAVTKTADGRMILNGNFRGRRNADDVTLAAGTYVFSIAYTAGSISDALQMEIKDSGGTTLTESSLLFYPATAYGTQTAVITIPSDGLYHFSVYSYANMTNLTLGVQLENGSTATAFAPYSNICPISGRTGCNISHSGADTSDPTVIPISWASEAGTVYGGTLDVTSGVLTVTHGVIDIGTYDNIGGGNGAFSFSNVSTKIGTLGVMSDVKADCYKTVTATYSSAVINKDDYSVMQSSVSATELYVKDTRYSTYAEFKAANVGTKLYYPLATPQTYQLAPTEVTTLLGQNNIWADTGDSTVEYPADTKLYIQKINTPTDDDMIADANIASGKYFIVNNNLYISTAAILAGDPIKPGTNCTLTNLAAALNALNS